MSYATAKIVGRIERSTRPRGGYENWSTIILMPAVDSYSFPQVVEVYSKSELGKKGDDLEVDVVISGYKNNFTYIDKDSGEERLVYSARIFLNAV